MFFCVNTDRLLYVAMKPVVVHSSVFTAIKSGFNDNVLELYLNMVNNIKNTPCSCCCVITG